MRIKTYRGEAPDETLVEEQGALEDEVEPGSTPPKASGATVPGNEEDADGEV